MDSTAEEPLGADAGSTSPKGGDVPQVPGYELLGVLGAGSSGRVWRGRRAGPDVGGPAEHVAVKIVHGGERAERELAVLRGVRHEHVVGLHEGVPLPDGSLALVLDLVEGGTLAQLVAARGHLRPGEVVTVIAPLAAALAELHAAGIQHGDLAPGNVLFDADGRPLLGDLGTVRITGEARAEQFGTPGYVDPVVVAGGPGGPASDVYGLGALAWFALTGRTPPGALLRGPLDDEVPGLPGKLVAAVETALDPDPARRPDPATFARQVFEAASPEPVWLVGSTPADGGLTHRIRQLAASDVDTDRPRHRGRRSGARTAVVTSAVLVVAAVATFAAGQGLTREGPAGSRVEAQPAAAMTGSSPARPTMTAVPGRLSDAQAVTVVQQLSSARAAAFASADAAVLASTTSPGSAADLAARAALASLRRQGLVYRGLALRVRSAHVVSITDGGLVMDVVSDVSDYDVVDGSGVVRRHESARPGTSSRLVLLATGQGWRVKDVVDVGNAPG